MSSSKTTKRWHGNVEAIKAEFLNGVVKQMESYGDRVHFSMFGSVQKPHYEVINSFDKKMAFDGNHHLHRAEDETEFGPGNVTPIFTLEQIKRIIATGGSGVRSSIPRAARAASARSTGTARPTTAAARAREAVDSEKYVYFKANREMLPEGINQYSDEISALMLKGMSAEQAFGEIITKHFD
ncbi:hypothetical protein J8I26_22210 [Herbaspirillum sp. LeCh32-8]|uniref:hypothetical protein n=1 Tax=Herbaspirillum sp. LeCh32-8 TaxID=2821356 RepID=UPI001AE882A7|nr:hypothetical protein [Herbaspirillum sp. LeCh32-8]MBP0600840.1 hypothetical protein [Herbaspirillum sp. LeCh32-8]